MLIPCEVAVKCLLPPVRALIAKTLTTKHNLTQEEAAKRLGISQPAISLYERKMRGKALNLENEPEITKLIENLADALAKGNLSHKEFIQRFCEICRTIRAKGLLCQLHKNFNPALDMEKCELCLTTNALKCM
ncbi:MAG: helix-turn-helix domain-containing protein [Candidatus Bathyarchaeia archaeon]